MSDELHHHHGRSVPLFCLSPRQDISSSGFDDVEDN